MTADEHSRGPQAPGHVYRAHLWRLAHDIDWLSEDAAAATLQQMVDNTRPQDREFIRQFTADADALRRSEPWVGALRTMREYRWSSY
jgi:hypothetical protein